MSRPRHCNIVRVRANDSAWQADRYDDKLVFAAILRRRRNGLSIDRAIAALFASDEWRPKMNSKKPASWKRQYLKKRELGDARHSN